jgi:hypothetical protein
MSAQTLLDEGEWLQAGRVDAAQLRAWEESRRIFKVSINGTDYYPLYQFDDSLQPRPVIGAVIAETEGADPLALAAWFHYPNGWITTDGWHPVAPRLVLDQPDLVLAAARKRRGTYIA